MDFCYVRVVGVCQVSRLHIRSMRVALQKQGEAHDGRWQEGLKEAQGGGGEGAGSAEELWHHWITGGRGTKRDEGEVGMKIGRNEGRKRLVRERQQLLGPASPHEEPRTSSQKELEMSDA